jgi:hypothetical protein
MKWQWAAAFSLVLLAGLRLANAQNATISFTVDNTDNEPIYVYVWDENAGHSQVIGPQLLQQNVQVPLKVQAGSNGTGSISWKSQGSVTTSCQRSSTATVSSGDNVIIRACS